MITWEAISSLGFKDRSKCEDVARFLNGIINIAEGDRKSDLDQFFVSVFSLASDLARVKAELDDRCRKFDLLKIQVNDLMALNERLNASVKELTSANMNVTAENRALILRVDEAVAEHADTKRELDGEKERVARLIEEQQRIVAESKQGSVPTSDPSAAVIRHSPGSAKPDGNLLSLRTEMDRLKKELASSEEEKGRLGEIVKTLTAIPVSEGSFATSVGSKERSAARRTVPSDEHQRVLRQLHDAQSKLEVLGNDAIMGVSPARLAEAEKKANALSEKVASLQKELDACRTSNLSLQRSPSVPGQSLSLDHASQPVVPTGGKPLEDGSSGVDTADEFQLALNRKLEATLMIELIKENRDQLQTYITHFQMQAHVPFSLGDGSLMVCPVPLRTGVLMQLGDVYAQWKTYPSDHEGTYYASILCPYSGKSTSLASLDQLYLIDRIAVGLRVSMMLPFKFQHKTSTGVWVDFPLFDQIAIASICCKNYRSGNSSCMDSIAVCGTEFVLHMHVLNNSVDFQMHSTFNPCDTRAVCVHLHYSAALFERWTFFARQFETDG